jgi:hypothetical protein
MQLVGRFICNQLLNKALKTYKGLEVWLHAFLNSAVDVGALGFPAPLKGEIP